MTLTIGVAIPCYSGHVNYIVPLLDNITSSIRVPDDIVISCSSSENDRILSFVHKGVPVRIWYSTERLNQATNRNRAASLLKTDLISFFDADDLMHPKRLAFVCDVFESRPDISGIYHNYSLESVSCRDNPFWEESEPIIINESIVRHPTLPGILVFTRRDNGYAIHHAQVTIRRDVFSTLKFDEDWKYYRIEDSVYGAKLVNNKVPLLYLYNRLSRYIS